MKNGDDLYQSWVCFNTNVYQKGVPFYFVAKAGNFSLQE